MLRDTITYGKELILTIYHVNPELDIKGRCWTVKEKIGRYNVIFEEKSVDMSFDEIINGVETEQMLLSAKETLSLCVNIPLRRRRESGKADSASPAKTAALRSLSLLRIQSVDLPHGDIL